ncbi:MAG: PocR ligand-binding domain-containing protein [Clostridia bacterium]|nr:PocR ligand-binding domain-containing protein [Clostridia bacterium]
MLKTDKLRLREVIKAFYDLTGVKIAIYDTGFKEITSFPEANSEFCSKMQENEKTRLLCDECNARHFLECEKNRAKPIMQKCHAGLTEVASVISDGDRVIGYAIYGQITNEESHEEFVEDVKKRCEEYGYDNRWIEESCEKIKYVSATKLEAISFLLDMTVSYIIQNRLAYSDSETLGEEIVQYINKNLSSPLGIEELCKYFFVSRSMLYKLTKPYMPRGVFAYIKEKRLEASKELLLTTNLTSKEIAKKTGFGDVNYFLRTFKKEVGIPANKYKKENSKKRRKMP